MTSSRKREQGFAVLVVLWTMGLLALLISWVLTVARQDSQQARNQLHAAAVEAAAQGALQHAIFAALDTSSRGWPADGLTRIIEVNDTRIAIRIEGEERKLNPNVASAAEMQAVMIGIGVDPALAEGVAASIQEWRTATSVPGRPNSVILRYRSAGRAYGPSGLPFSSLDELGLVMGMTPELLSVLKPFLTLYADQDTAGDSGGFVGARSFRGISPRLLSISLEAEGTDHSRLAVRSVVRLNAQARGKRWEILFYEQPTARTP